MKILIHIITLVLFIAGHAAFAQGNVDAGKEKSATCVACHGADGNGNVANPEWPKLAGQGAPYLAQQLNLFKNNERVNVLMNGQAANLSEQDIQDIAAYYASLETSPGAADAESVELGQAIYRGGIIKKGVTACSACHSPRGAGNPAAKFPKLSGQHVKYTELQLKSYRGLERNYPSAQIMVAVAERMSDKEIAAVAQYIAGLH